MHLTLNPVPSDLIALNLSAPFFLVLWGAFSTHAPSKNPAFLNANSTIFIVGFSTLFSCIPLGILSILTSSI